MQDATWPFNATAERRFWSKVKIGAPDECWPWTARLDRYGYGQFRMGGKGSPNRTASRCAWMLTHLRAPTGLVRHSCDNRICCNPAHLRDGTSQANSRDMTMRGRQFVADGHRRLTDDEWRQIIVRHAVGETQRALGDEFGIGQSAISLVVLGKRRRYLTAGEACP